TPRRCGCDRVLPFRSSPRKRGPSSLDDGAVGCFCGRCPDAVASSWTGLGRRFRGDERSWGMAFCTYIVASERNGTIYTGSTDDLVTRVFQHKNKTYAGFTAKHGVDQLVWFEVHESREAAFRRERQIKKWN